MILVAVVLFCAVCILPMVYSRYIINKHAGNVERIRGSGGQLAEHLVKNFQLSVTVQKTDKGDHYDPIAKAVRLGDMAMNGKSLSAVAIAAHEVGHAIQDHQQSSMLRLRTRLVMLLQPLEKVITLLFWLSPMVMLWSPRIGLLLLLLALAALGSRVVVHLVTLPVEFDASFGKALPILRQGNYVETEDYGVIKKILTACAFTYVSAALLEFVNIWRWLRFMRRA